MKWVEMDARLSTNRRYKTHAFYIQRDRQFQGNMASAVLDLGIVLVMAGFYGRKGGAINITGIGACSKMRELDFSFQFHL